MTRASVADELKLLEEARAQRFEVHRLKLAHVYAKAEAKDAKEAFEAAQKKLMQMLGEEEDTNPDEDPGDGPLVREMERRAEDGDELGDRVASYGAKHPESELGSSGAPSEPAAPKKRGRGRAKEPTS
jgi:hypothetical protein